jgi:hypothetical protein
MKTWTTEIRRTVPRLVKAFTARLRESDRREALGMTGAFGESLSRMMITDIGEAQAAGGKTWFMWLGNKPVAICGILPDSLTATSATIWMLATKEVEQHPLAFARWTRKYFLEAKTHFPHITTFHNYAPIQDTQLTSWLQWLGATMRTSDTFVSPFTGETFTNFKISGG